MSNIAFSFVVGIFFGVFFVDLAHSVNLSVRIRAFAKQHDVVVAYEKLKVSIKTRMDDLRAKSRIDELREKAEKGMEKLKKASFFFPFRSDKSLEDSLEDYVRANGNGDKPKRKK